MIIQAEADKELARKILQDEAETTGNLLEWCVLQITFLMFIIDTLLCSACCYGTYIFEQMTQCAEGHIFCLECGRRNAENEVGNRKYVLYCMHSDGCKATFPRREVERFVDTKTMEALSNLEQEDAIFQAGIIDLESCPFCPFCKFMLLFRGYLLICGS